MCVLQVIAGAASLQLSASGDSASRAVIPPNYALITHVAADKLLMRLLKKLNWWRLRLCLIGQREAGCMFALLNDEILTTILQAVLVETR